MIKSRLRLLLALLTIAATTCHADKHTWQWPYPQTADPTIKILKNSGYISAYSECKRSALWVSYPLTRKRFYKWPKRRPRFRPDSRTGSHVTPDDYWLSGYTRGHLAPGYAVWAVSGPQARKETYLMSNISPQKKYLNQKLWQRLEEIAADHFTDYFDTITVYTGPVFTDPQEYLDSGLAVPDAFYKIFSAYRDGQVLVLGFIMPQNVRGTEPLDAYVTTIDRIEQLTDIDFFHWLPASQQQKIESTVVTQPWNLKNLSNLPGRY